MNDEILVVWCEDTEEWGIVNGKSNNTWKRFPDTARGIKDCVDSIHAIGWDAEILLGQGESRKYTYITGA